MTTYSWLQILGISLWVIYLTIDSIITDRNIDKLSDRLTKAQADLDKLKARLDKLESEIHDQV